MLKYYRRYRYSREVAKIKSGDGHMLKPFRFWQMITRTLYHIKIENAEGHADKYSVDVEYYEVGDEVKLYLNDKHIGTSSTPATFPVAGGYIEVQTTLYGLKRMHYVSDHGEDRLMEPDPRTAEGLREKLELNYPLASRLISSAAVFILLISLVLGLPQIIEYVTHIDFISERFGTFNSPIHLPNWLNITLSILAVTAALERALTLKNHWLIDMDTTTYGDS